VRSATVVLCLTPADAHRPTEHRRRLCPPPPPFSSPCLPLAYLLVRYECERSAEYNRSAYSTDPLIHPLHLLHLLHLLPHGWCSANCAGLCRPPPTRCTPRHIRYVPRRTTTRDDRPVAAAPNRCLHRLGRHQNRAAHRVRFVRARSPPPLWSVTTILRVVAFVARARGGWAGPGVLCFLPLGDVGLGPNVRYMCATVCLLSA